MGSHAEGVPEGLLREHLPRTWAGPGGAGRVRGLPLLTFHEEEGGKRMHRAQEGAARVGEMVTAWHRRWARTLTVTNTEDNGNLLALNNLSTVSAVELPCHRALSSSCVLLKGQAKLILLSFMLSSISKELFPHAINI